MRGLVRAVLRRFAYAGVLSVSLVGLPKARFGSKTSSLVDRSRHSGTVGGRSPSPNVTRALHYYGRHYDVLFSTGRHNPTSGRQYLGSAESPRRCRFCGRREPDAIFAHEAHAIPRFLGNRTLLMLDECDACNERLSRSEDDLAKLTLPARVFARMPGYRGMPTAKDVQSDRWRIKADPIAVRLYANYGTKQWEVDAITRSLRVRIPLQKYRPNGAFKALLKMALSVMPNGELGNFNEATEWMASEGVVENAVDDGTGFRCVRITGARCVRYPVAFLLRRKPGTSVPYAFFSMTFGYWTYQIWLPCPCKNAELEGRKVDLWAFPTLDMTRPVSLDEEARIEWLYLDSTEPVTDQEWPISFRYSSMAQQSNIPVQTPPI